MATRRASPSRPRRTRRPKLSRRAPAVVVAAAAALAAAGCGGSRSAPASRAPALQVVEHVSLGSARAWPLPASWAVSFDAQLNPGSRVSVSFGARASSFVLGHSQHVERVGRAGSLSLRLLAGHASVDALIISPLHDRGALLLHRLAELHARVPVGRVPFGADLADRVHYRGGAYWTSGFWPGALWEAAALAGRSGGTLFAQWALRSTEAQFGFERANTHDVGFVYGQSSLSAWRALCRPPTIAVGALCARLRRSVLAAADELLALAASNSRAGTIPTRAGGARATTLIDSMMNIAILPWASSVTGDQRYGRVALRHALRIASLLVRPDGSTAQAALFDRATGRLLAIRSFQGISASSTWARGQGWAVYGFAVAADQLRSPALLRVALRAARFVARRLPASGVPRWDYDARPGAAVDVSAGVVTAAGLEHLVRACATVRGVCGSVAPLRSLARLMLDAALRRGSSVPPLGFLASQVLSERFGPGCWCNRGELVFGVAYGLEALALGA